MILVVFMVRPDDVKALDAIKAVTGWDYRRRNLKRLHRVENFFPGFHWCGFACPFVQEDLTIHVIGFGHGPCPIPEDRMPVNAFVKLSSGEPVPYDDWWEGTVFLRSYHIAAIELAARDLTCDFLLSLQSRSAMRPDDTFVRQRQIAEYQRYQANLLRTQKEYSKMIERHKAATKPTFQDTLIRQNERLIEEVRDLRNEVSRHRYD